MCNPVTGRRMNLTWMAREIFPLLTEFYFELEELLGTKFYYPKPLFRIFDTTETQNDWLGRGASGAYMPFAGSHSFAVVNNEGIINPFGGMMVSGGGYLDTRTFLEASRKRFLALNYLTETTDFIDVNEITDAEFIVFCNGYASSGIPFFDEQPHQLVKGELLTVNMKGVSKEYILVGQRIFVVPVQGDVYRVAATYNWDLKPGITKVAEEELLSSLQRIVQTSEIEVIKHEWGIRPATAHRRPFIGPHPQNPQWIYFNGFGSKGVSLIPYFSAKLADYLTTGVELPAETLPANLK